MSEKTGEGTRTEQSPYALWSPTTLFPPHDEMPDLDIVTHVSIEKAAIGGYFYLHETAIASHRGSLYLCWANHREREVNERDELIRGTRSTDGGLAWEPPKIWAAAPRGEADGYNHPVLIERADRLWGFFTRWDDAQPTTEVFALDDKSGRWQSQGSRIPGFLPFRPPMKLSNGNWIMGGELGWTEPAVAVSHGDDFTAWDAVQIPRPEDMVLRFPETALMDLGERLVAICRPRNMDTAPVSVSEDYGRSWTTMRPSNFPLASSQPYCGRLSTGQHYLITNNREEGRTLLSIAVTRPSGEHFERIWKIRHQKTPKRRLVGGEGEHSRRGQPTEWSYPATVESEGKLYVSYTQGKEDCALSIIPVSVLNA